jgi:hypothetical protein
MLTFKVARFDIGYNCILGRPFLLKFMVVIHTAYATMKMLGLKGAITIKADQLDALACENTSLSHAGRFDDKATQDQMAKIHSGKALRKTSTSKSPTSSTPRTPMGTTTQKGINIASASAQPPTNQKSGNKNKGPTEDESSKEILTNLDDLEKKLKISMKLDPK